MNEMGLSELIARGFERVTKWTPHKDTDQKKVTDLFLAKEIGRE